MGLRREPPDRSENAAGSRPDTRAGAVAPTRARRRWRSARLLVPATLAVVLAVWAASWRPLEVSGAQPQDGFTRVSGVIHVHTRYSDGGGTVEEVVRAARQTGLDFVIVTDHNNLDAKSKEGRYGRVLLLVGTEVSSSAGYLLGLGIPDPAFRFSGDPREALDDIRQLGGVAFAAHPTSPREEFSWRGWDLAGDWGLEVLNLDCQWRDASWPRLARAALLYPLGSRHALLGMLSRPNSVLRRWDALLRHRHVPAIAAADAHSRIALPGKRSLRFPSYQALFAIARNHVLLDSPLAGDFDGDARAILVALAEGRSYLALDALAPADGFFFEAAADGRRWTMGDTVPAELRPRLRAGGRLPRGARLVLLRDGQPIAEGEGRLGYQAPGPGSYRVEVYAPGWGMPWVLSNPIYVLDPVELEARRRSALPPAEASAPVLDRVLDDFEGATIFRPEFDPSSSMGSDVLDPTAPWQGRYAGKMSFRLGDGDAGRHSASCALVTRAPRDWTGAHGLAFAIRGDGTYRVHLQVRDRNPSGRDDGTETWFASAKATSDWRRVAIPFTSLRSTDPMTDGHLDLGQIRLLAFVVDKGADKVGTRGRIWLDEIGVY